MTAFRTFASIALAVLTPSHILAQTPLNQQEPKYLKATAGDMKWWRAARFGLFIHWDPVSLKGTEISWSRGRGGIPVEEYDSLYKKFNPTKFDANAWVKLAKDAGMKYLVFTTKHHDGFAMFDSKLTDYKITNSPFGRDVVAELAAACHKAGLKLGFYYSPPDWHHPDFRTANHTRYIKYMHGQIRELLTRYGKVDIFWFDGLDTNAKELDSQNLFKMMRQLQPHIIINNRAGLPGDWDTPEQTIGRFQNDRPWESCITICRQWAWKPGDEMKSLKECLQTLILCAGGDGNLLFNVGPMPTGEIEPRQSVRLREMGAWLKKYGKTIYSTRGGPYKPSSWGASTYTGSTVYLHVFKWPDGPLVLPPLPSEIVGHRVLTGGGASIKQSTDSILIDLPTKYRQDIDTIVELDLDSDAGEMSPVHSPSHSLAYGKLARATNVFQNMDEYTPDKALDDDENTRWATDAGTHSAWLEVDLGEPKQIGRAVIREEYGNRIEEFQLLARNSFTEAWQPMLSGSGIGTEGSFAFKPTTARFIRLNILKASEGPTISEFQLFGP